MRCLRRNRKRDERNTRYYLLFNVTMRRYYYYIINNHRVLLYHYIIMFLTMRYFNVKQKIAIEIYNNNNMCVYLKCNTNSGHRVDQFPSSPH